jgi:hypothetical protein
MKPLRCGLEGANGMGKPKGTRDRERQVGPKTWALARVCNNTFKCRYGHLVRNNVDCLEEQR